ncbi:MAG: tetratricopeptide repeat protein [Candidatus Zixiibacteriota bacterium]|nr:MAG: tetratricopeptide repeat protein [candidate division Zixibacteria bacterium]
MNKVRQLAIAAGIALALVSGCATEKGKHYRYTAERLFHRADQMHKKAAIRAAAGDSRILAEVKDAYRKTIDYCWQYIDSLSRDKNPEERLEFETVAFLAVERLVGIHFAERKYDSAQLILSQLLTFTRLEGVQLLRSQLHLARSHQLAGNQAEAIAIYHRLLDIFYPPVDDKNQVIFDVLNLPLEIIAVNRTVQNEEIVARESESAKSYYKRIIGEWPNTTLATAARGIIARILTDEEDYQAAIENLRQIRDSTGQTDREARLVIAELTGSGLGDYQSAILMYDELLAQTTDTMVLPDIYLRKGIALYQAKYYQECREVMKLIKNNYESFFIQNPAPQNYLGMAFEKEGNWERAETEYLRVIDGYPTTEAAFNTYLVIAQHYTDTNNDQIAELWYRRAEEFYQKMAATYAGTTVEPSAIAFTAEIARRKQQWQKAADILIGLYERFPGTEVGQKAMVNAAGVYRNRLNDEITANSLLERLRRELVPTQADKNIGSNSDDY